MTLANITTGNQAGDRLALRLDSETATLGTSSLLVAGITDFTINETNNIASYNTVDSLDTLKFATTSDRTLTFTYLSQSDVDPDLDTWFQNKNEIQWRLSRFGESTGDDYKQGKTYISDLNTTKNGTNIYEISITLAVNGAVTKGTW